MRELLQALLTERQLWQQTFDRLLKFGSEGVLQKEILQAKEIFFSKLGRTHEMKEDLYESASQSFLEWYLFDYPTKFFSKNPAVIFLTLRAGNADELACLERSLFHHWSIFEVKSVTEGVIVLTDLLAKTEREVLYDAESPESKLWKVQNGDVIQARLFHLSKESYYFLTHLWLHPKPESEILKKLCEKEAANWGRHHDFMLSCFEAVVRTYGVEKQLKVSGSKNWLYQELVKKYA